MSSLLLFLVPFSGGGLGHLSEVTIRDIDTQPDCPITSRRDQTRTLVSSFNLESIDPSQALFHWRVDHVMLSPFNISVEPELLVYDTLELNIGPKLLLPGLKLIVFELHVIGTELAARDFAFLQVKKSALVASIAGGTELIRSLRKPISVDASSSYDPENGDGTSFGMSFNWSCFTVANKNSSGVDNVITSLLVNSSDGVLNTLVANGIIIQLQDVFLYSLEKGKVNLDIKKLTNNETYYVLLTVHKDSRAASVIQTIHIHDEEMVDVRIM